MSPNLIFEQSTEVPRVLFGAAGACALQTCARRTRAALSHGGHWSFGRPRARPWPTTYVRIHQMLTTDLDIDDDAEGRLLKRPRRHYNLRRSRLFYQVPGRNDRNTGKSIVNSRGRGKCYSYTQP